ncbi:MAG: sulfatase [Planctomycetota bacterium]|nr:sulfatase [Planctomycetota bacterium]
MRLLGAMALVLGAACSAGPAGTSEQLAGRFELAVTGAAPDPWTIEEPGPTGRLAVRQTFGPEAIGASALSGLREVAIDLTGRGGAPAGALERAAAEAGGQRLPRRADASAEGAAHRFFQGGRELLYTALPDRLDPASIAAAAAAFPAGGFTVLGDAVLFRPWPDTAGSPVEYVAVLDPQVDPDGLPRVDHGGSSYQGFGVPSGCRADLGELSWSEGAALVLGLAVRGTQGPELQLRVRVDGRVVHDEALAPASAPPIERRRIALGGRGGRLTIEATGGRAEALVLAPAITRARSLSTRPDLVVFLADTFRADNLARAGGDPRFTPRINAFADVSAYFERAWSTSSWTLPSQASLLTGLLPPSHGAVFEQLALDERHTTLPELLGRAGYRTVAVTEGGFVVPTFGLAQGFESFVVGPSNDLDATLANVRRVLAEDDGRPLFLYVQTFRAHSDYVATEAARAALPELFAEAPAAEAWDFRQLMDRIAADVGDPAFLTPLGSNAVMAPEVLSHPGLEDLHHLYRGGSWDVDAGFGEFLGLLEAAGLGAAPVVFTSDHGEAFGEHGIAGHGNSAFEEQLRVPLAIRLPDARPISTRHPASLLDLGPTLCELADVPVPEYWQGHSLVPVLRGGAADPGRPRLAFECPNLPSGLPAEFALETGGKKLVGVLGADGKPEPGSLRGYDLAEDPGEAAPTSDAAWLAPLAAEAARLVADYSEARFPAREIQLSAEAEAELRAMGYLGEAERPSGGPGGPDSTGRPGDPGGD